MLPINEIRRLPPNFDAFICDNARGMGSLYGPAAEAEYRETVFGRLQSALEQNSVRAIAAIDGTDAAGILLSSVSDAFGRIHFVHVLDRYKGTGVEEGMIRDAVAHIRHAPVDGIAAEYITFCALRDTPTFIALGFSERPRGIMIRDLPLNVGSPCSVETRPASLRDRRHIAQTILDAYSDHPSRILHPEVRSEARAVSFVRSALSGAYGPTQRGFSLLAGPASDPAGALLGCRVTPDVGFVLHLAVRPESQRRGIGARLLCEAARQFERAGLKRIALGVTLDNPARRLYERLGFELRHTLRACVWWRDPAVIAPIRR